MDGDQWKCTKCGLCCMLAIRTGLLDSSYDRGDGICQHLNDKNQCDIYENRPAVCNTRGNSPDATELERAEACAGITNFLNEGEYTHGRRRTVRTKKTLYM